MKTPCDPRLPIPTLHSPQHRRKECGLFSARKLGSKTHSSQLAFHSISKGGRKSNGVFVQPLFTVLGAGSKPLKEALEEAASSPSLASQQPVRHDLTLHQ